MSFAPIGLSDMYNGGGAVRSCSLRFVDGQPSFWVGIKGSGRFLAYCSRAPQQVQVEPSSLVLFHTYDASSGALRIDVPATSDLALQLSFQFERKG